jgi:glycosyltransferase involved in cell wall biosynthesis
VRIGINALYLIPGGVGGTESYLRNLIRAYQELDRENDFYVFTNVENTGTFQLRSSNFVEVPCAVNAVNRPARILWEQIALPLQVARAHVDVLHSPGYTAPVLTSAASVVTIHDLNYHYFPEDWTTSGLWANRILIPAVAHSATRVLTISHSSALAITQVLRVPTSKVDVVYHGVDGNLPPPVPGEEARARDRFGLTGPFLLSVTASHPHKNLDGLVSAYELLCAEWDAPPTLVIVGIKGRQQDALERRLKASASRGRVVLTGWIEGETLAALYRAAHLFVFPSKYEGFGFPVLEAMACDVPVVSSVATSLAELVGDAGVVFDPESPRSMAQAIRSTWENHALRQTLVERGRAQAARFTWRRAAEQTLECYRRAHEA